MTRLALLALSFCLMGCQLKEPDKRTKRRDPVRVMEMLAIHQGPRASVIYGEDDRLDLFEVEDENLVTLARSTAALFHYSSLPVTDGVAPIPGRTLGQSMNLCEEEPFRDQPSPANCSGFLVGPDLLVTAGHCIRSQAHCEMMRWVFDFSIDEEGKIPQFAKEENIYGCAELVTQALEEDELGEPTLDHALIRLDRVVPDRDPLPIRREGRPNTGDPLVVIGHPSGIPTKVAGGAAVRSLTPHYLIANLDTYGGNSGSAVLNSLTGLAEGILVRGEQDYDWKGSCRVSFRCSDDECRGEDVSLLDPLRDFI